MGSIFRKLFSSVLIITTIFTWIPLVPSVHAQSNPTGSIKTSRLILPITPNATAIFEKGGDGSETKHLLVTDYLSSTKTIVDENGTIVNTPVYYPYGNQTIKIVPPPKQTPIPLSNDSSNVTSNQSQITNRYYTGQRKVADGSAIYNYNARYYNPDYALFTQPDSVEGLNRYAYVGGNPIMNNDPSGTTMTTGGDEGGYASTRNPMARNMARNAPPKDYYKELIGVADNPVHATPCSKNYTNCAIGYVNEFTGIYSLAAMGDRMGTIQSIAKDSRQYVSRTNAEMIFMLQLAQTATGIAVWAGGPGSLGSTRSLIRQFINDERGGGGVLDESSGPVQNMMDRRYEEILESLRAQGRGTVVLNDSGDMDITQILDRLREQGYSINEARLSPEISQEELRQRLGVDLVVKYGQGRYVTDKLSASKACVVLRCYDQALANPEEANLARIVYQALRYTRGGSIITFSGNEPRLEGIPELADAFFEFLGVYTVR